MTLAIVTTMRSTDQSKSVRNVLAAGLKKCAKTVARILNQPTSSLAIPDSVLAPSVVPFLATRNLEGTRMLAKMCRVSKAMNKAVKKIKDWDDLVNEARKRQALSKKLLG